jgi:hypothetical protein
MIPASQNHSPQPDLPEMTDLRRRSHRSRQDAPGIRKQSRTVRQIQPREFSRGRRTILIPGIHREWSGDEIE